jgi:predicted aspartyl protease
MTRKVIPLGLLMTVLATAATGRLTAANEQGTQGGVGFTFVRDTSLIAIPVLINDRGPYRFLLDTGASHSILSLDVANQLKIATGRTENLITASGKVPVTVRTIEMIEIAEIRLVQVPIAVADFELLRSLHVDGILGGDYLRRFTVAIDYTRKLVRIDD